VIRALAASIPKVMRTDAKRESDFRYAMFRLTEPFRSGVSNRIRDFDFRESRPWEAIAMFDRITDRVCFGNPAGRSGATNEGTFVVEQPLTTRVSVTRAISRIRKRVSPNALGM